MSAPHSQTSGAGIKPTTFQLSGKAVVVVILIIIMVDVLIVDGYRIKINCSNQDNNIQKMSSVTGVPQIAASLVSATMLNCDEKKLTNIVVLGFELPPFLLLCSPVLKLLCHIVCEFYSNLVLAAPAICWTVHCALCTVLLL